MGGKSYYEINSSIPLNLNSYGGSKGFVLNDEGQVELWSNDEQVLEKRHYYSDEEWDNEVDYETEYFWDKMRAKKWWGKTLDCYYPHPYYPEKQILAFEIIRELPFNSVGTIEQVVGGGENAWIELESPDGAYDFTVSDCLLCPEFFKPLYE